MPLKYLIRIKQFSITMWHPSIIIIIKKSVSLISSILIWKLSILGFLWRIVISRITVIARIFWIASKLYIFLSHTWVVRFHSLFFFVSHFVWGCKHIIHLFAEWLTFLTLKFHIMKFMWATFAIQNIYNILSHILAIIFIFISEKVLEVF